MLQLTPNRDWQDYAGEYIPRTRGSEEINPIIYSTPYEIVSNQQSERNIYAYDPNNLIEYDERATAFAVALNLYNVQFRGGTEYTRDFYVGITNIAKMFGVSKSTAMNYYGYACRKGYVKDCGVYKHYDAPLKNYNGYLHTTIWCHNISIYKANKLRSLLKNADPKVDKLQMIIDFCNTKDKAVVKLKDFPEDVQPLDNLKQDYEDYQDVQQLKQQQQEQFITNFNLTMAIDNHIQEQQVDNSTPETGTDNNFFTCHLKTKSIVVQERVLRV